jgi:hypothetical protein
LHKSRNKNLLSFSVAVVALLAVGLGCASSTPPPTHYVGAWTGADGTLLTIRDDGSGDYKSGSSNVTNGSVTVDEGAKTLKLTLAGMGPKYKIDTPPTGNEMTLDGVVYRKPGPKIHPKSDAAPVKSNNTGAEIPSNGK